MVAKSASINAEQHIELQRSSLRGRRPVRADRRLCTDEKRIRAQSAILYENPDPIEVLSKAHAVLGVDLITA
jgi:hypothetical protein